MSIKEQIQKDRLQARKDRDEAKTGTLSYLLGQIETQEKQPNAKGDIALGIVKAYKKSLEENLKVVAADSEQGKAYLADLELVKAYLPEQVNTEIVWEYIKGQVMGGCDKKGLIMKALKAEFGETVDMKTAGSLVDQALNPK